MYEGQKIISSFTFSVNGDFVIFQVLWAVSLPVSGLTAMEAGACLCYASNRLQSNNSGSGFGNFLAFPFITLLGGSFVLSLSISNHHNGLLFGENPETSLNRGGIEERVKPEYAGLSKAKNTQSQFTV